PPRFEILGPVAGTNLAEDRSLLVRIQLSVQVRRDHFEGPAKFWRKGFKIDVQQLTSGLEEEFSKFHRLHPKREAKPSITPVLEIECDESELRSAGKIDERLGAGAFA